MDTWQQIEATLEAQVRPVLRGHGGGVRLKGYQDGIVTVELLGACSGCPSADLSTREMIEDILRNALPEIKGIALSHPVDQELLDFARKLLRHEE